MSKAKPTYSNCYSFGTLNNINDDINLTHCLSFREEQQWFVHQLEPNKPIYTIPLAYRIEGALDTQALEKSLEHLIHRHENLRTTYKQTTTDERVRVIADANTFTLLITDLSDQPNQTKQQATQRLLQEEAEVVFDLQQDPLFRVQLLRLSPLEHILMMTFHHIIIDGRSVVILRQELGTLYQAFQQKITCSLPTIPLRYADFAQWQRINLSIYFATQLDYWKEHLKDAPPLIHLPTDYPRPPRPSHRGESIILSLPSDLTANLRQLSQQENTTLFLVLMTALKTLLFNYCSQKNIVVGIPVANRNAPDAKDTIGFFVNTLAIHTRLQSTSSFIETIRHVRDNAANGYQHQDIPFEQVVKALQPERSLSYHPVFQVMLVKQHTQKKPLHLDGLKVTPLHKKMQTAEFDLMLIVNNSNDLLQITFNYSLDLFKRATIERMVGHFKTLLESIANNPHQTIGELPLLTKSEHQQILFDWNQTQVSYPSHLCLHHLVEAQATQSPDTTAIIFAEQQLTYSELNNRANQLASYLLTHTLCGIQHNPLVALCVERSLDLPIVLLGILKAGAAYVPIDPNYPAERVQYILKDCQAPILITQKHLKKQLLSPTNNSNTYKTIYLDEFDWQMSYTYTENPASSVTSADLAYVIYTSGSSGKPKGTMNTHQGIVNRVLWTKQFYQYSPQDCIL